MSDVTRSNLYAFDLVQRRAKKPAGAPDKSLARPVTKVGIVGAGLMASQLALLFARQMKVPVVMTEPGKTNNRVVYIVKIEPPETVIVEINLPKARVFIVHTVHFLDEMLCSPVQGIMLGQVPVKAHLAVPFRPLAELTAHEKQLFAGMAPLQQEKEAEVGKLLPVVPWHF